MAAFAKAQEWGDRIPIGVIYRNPGKPVFEEHLSALKDGPLVRQRIEPGRIERFIGEFI